MPPSCVGHLLPCIRFIHDVLHINIYLYLHLHVPCLSDSSANNDISYNDGSIISIIVFIRTRGTQIEHIIDGTVQQILKIKGE